MNRISRRELLRLGTIACAPKVVDATVVRGYEVEGRETPGAPLLVGDADSISEVDLLEEGPKPVKKVVWRPYELKTLKME